MLIGCKKFVHIEEFRMGLHSHVEGQLFMLLDGAVIFITEEGERLMTPQRPCWVPSGIAHGVRTRGHMSGITLMADPSLCLGLPEQISIYKSSRFIHSLANHMALVGADTDRLARMWAVMCDELAAAEKEELYLPVPRDEKLRRLTDMLAKNPEDTRDLPEWAESINMAQRTLVRKFRAETGMSFVSWRQRARVMLAINLLSEGHSVTDVALSVGYDSLSAFISVFKNITGVSPMQYVQTAPAPVVSLDAMEHH